MKTNKVKKEVKSTKLPALPEEPQVMHTAGGEMPRTRKGHNPEYVNAKITYSKKSKS